MRSVVAEFASPEKLTHAIRSLRGDGYERMDAFAPYPVEEAEHALGLQRSRLPWVVFAIGVAGAATGYAIQWGTNGFLYPLSVGARPTGAWPPLIPITFETTVLFAGFAAFFGFLWLARLPTLWAPLDEIEGFDRASDDRFWLAVELGPADDDDLLMRRLADLDALRVVKS